jgi:hypothetical protein
MGIHWEQGGKKQKLLVPTPHSKRKKKIGSIMSHAEPSHWLHEISIFKTVCLAIFGLG